MKERGKKEEERRKMREENIRNEDAVGSGYVRLC